MDLEISNIIKSLGKIKVNKVVGFDNIFSIIILLLGIVIVEGLISVFKSSFVFRFMFYMWKRVKVIFIFKKGFKFDIGNYRFVLLFSIFSKILEY